MYAYLDWEEPALNDKYAIMSMQGISNNRDGMALRVLSEKLTKAPQTTKLLISLSDGQPKAMPDYTGNSAAEDMKQTINEYSRKGMSDLKQLPMRLVQIIARYL